MAGHLLEAAGAVGRRGGALEALADAGADALLAVGAETLEERLVHRRRDELAARRDGVGVGRLHAAQVLLVEVLRELDRELGRIADLAADEVLRQARHEEVLAVHRAPRALLFGERRGVRMRLGQRTAVLGLRRIVELDHVLGLHLVAGGEVLELRQRAAGAVDLRLHLLVRDGGVRRVDRDAVEVGEVEGRNQVDRRLEGKGAVLVGAAVLDRNDFEDLQAVLLDRLFVGLADRAVLGFAGDAVAVGLRDHRGRGVALAEAGQRRLGGKGLRDVGANLGHLFGRGGDVENGTGLGNGLDVGFHVGKKRDCPCKG